LQVAITNAAGAANHSTVTFTVKDGFGTAIAYPVIFTFWLSDAATGLAVTATTASGGFAAGASGSIFGTLTTSKCAVAQTTAAGVFILDITDTSKTTFYPCAQLLGITTVGAQLTAGSYG